MSGLPFELLLALRYLRPKRTFVSVITLISVLGVTLGVAVLIIVISVMSGFDRQLRDKILGFNAHLTVSKSTSTMQDYALVANAISSNRNIHGLSPFVVGRVLIETQVETNRQASVDAPVMRGVDPQTEGKISNLPRSMVAGKFDLEGRGLLVGREFARNLRLHVGDHLSIFSPREIERIRRSRDKSEEEAILPDDYEVRGIFDTGYYEYNASVVIASLENAQDMYDLGDSVHGLLVVLHDPYQAAMVKRQLEESLGGEYSVSTWMEQNSSILNALIVEKKVMFYLLFFIMVVAAFGITSALITFVVQKTREIGMLKALGASNWQISGIFLGQSAMVGVIGVVLGYGLGMLAIEYRNEFLHVMNRATGFELFPASIYGFAELPALVVPGDIAVICGSALCICVLAGLIPAWQASRLKPVEALRHE